MLSNIISGSPGKEISNQIGKFGFSPEVSVNVFSSLSVVQFSNHLKEANTLVSFTSRITVIRLKI